MKLIVGLGNPGKSYANNRHNIGFRITDFLSREFLFPTWKCSDIFLSCRGKIDGQDIILIKPSTYMNLSGRAIRYWMQQEKIPQERILVVADEISLPFGKIRLRGKGSDGGHNGLKNVQEILGNSNYARVRFGIAAEYTKGKQVDYVLGKWNSEEKDGLQERIEIVVELIKSFTTNPIQRVMSEFNGK